MTDHENRPISLEEAKIAIGLEIIDDTTFSLPGVLIRVFANELAITHLKTPHFSTSEDTLHTVYPFEFFSIAQKKKYVLRADQGNLTIEEALISST